MTRASFTDLLVWQLGPDDFFVANRLPDNLSTSTTTDAANKTVKTIKFDVTGTITSVATSFKCWRDQVGVRWERAVSFVGVA